MKKVKEETADIYRFYGDGYKEAERKLSKRKAIQNTWLINAGLYPNDTSPQGVGFQLYRSNWFNEKGNGLHFESWMAKSYHEKGEVPFVFHIEAGKSRAGFGQKDFSQAFLRRCGDILEEKGYEINTRYALEPVKCFRPMTPKSFVSVVDKEFAMLSKLGKVVDAIISELLNK